MQRYFTDNFNMKDNKATLISADFHHVKNVMRSKIGDHIIVCDLNKNCYRSTITALSNEVVVSLTEKLEDKELPVNIDIAQGLIRRERFEYMLQKSTELGVRNIIPVKSKYSIVQLDSKKQTKKQDRWNKITKEASEQAHRSIIVRVNDIHTSFKTIPYQDYDLVLVAYEEENNSKNLQSCIDKSHKNILVVIGPEGGLHPEEITFFKTLDNVEMVGLGKRILRSETASTYVLSVLGFRFEMGDLS